MPDLSHRPTRYLTAAIVAAALAATATTHFDVRVGPDAQLTALQKQNAELKKQAQRTPVKTSALADRPVRRLVVRPSTTPSATPTAAHSSAPSRPGATHPAAAHVQTVAAKGGLSTDCAAYGTQEAAQAAFNAHPAQLAAMDGNHNGKACEQLRSAVGPAPVVIHEHDAPPVAAPAPPAGPVLPTAPPKAAIVASGQHFGMSVGTTEEFDSLEASLQRQADLTGFFTGFDSPFPRDRVVAAWNAGRIPMMTWESRPLSTTDDTTDYSLPRIVDGSYDAYLTTYAKAVKDLGLPVIIRFDQEMNGNWYRWAERRPDKTIDPALQGSYVAAWRHVHDIFEAQGANSSAIWLWSPNRIDNIQSWGGDLMPYWPGPEYVDEVGMTGYLRHEDVAAAHPKPYTFSSTYDLTLAELRRVAPGKPIMLSEVGATEELGHKVAWVTDFFAGLARTPGLVGFNWFDYAITADGRTTDWRINSTTAAYTAFKTGLLSTGYGLEVGKRFTLNPPATRLPTPAGPTPTPTVSAPEPTPRPGGTVRPGGTRTSTKGGRS